MHVKAIGTKKSEILAKITFLGIFGQILPKAPIVLLLGYIMQPISILPSILRSILRSILHSILCSILRSILRSILETRGASFVCFNTSTACR